MANCFLLTSLQVVYVLTTPKLHVVSIEEEMLDDLRRLPKWENDNEICLGHILSAISHGLFDVYHTISITKELWDNLEAKYIMKSLQVRSPLFLILITIKW